MYFASEIIHEVKVGLGLEKDDTVRDFFYFRIIRDLFREASKKRRKKNVHS